MVELDLEAAILSRANSKSSISLAGWSFIPFTQERGSRAKVEEDLRYYAWQNSDKIEWLIRNLPTFQLRIVQTSIHMGFFNPSKTLFRTMLYLPTKQDLMRWKLVR